MCTISFCVLILGLISYFQTLFCFIFVALFTYVIELAHSLASSASPSAC